MSVFLNNFFSVIMEDLSQKNIVIHVPIVMNNRDNRETRGLDARPTVSRFRFDVNIETDLSRMDAPKESFPEGVLRTDLRQNLRARQRYYQV